MNIKEHLPLREMKTAAKVAGRSALAMALTMSMARIALADSRGFIADSNAPRQTVFVDDGRFPQCQNVKFPDRTVLFEDPMKVDPKFPLNPQIRYAIDTFMSNRVDRITALQAIDLLPQGTKFRLGASSQIETYCLPDKNGGWSRSFIQVGEGSGINLPAGGKDGLVEIELPTGINPVVLKYAFHRQDGSVSEEEWLVFIARLDEEIKARNTDGSFTVIGRGPLAVPIYRNKQTGASSVEFVFPERGFGDDKPIPQPAMLARDYPQCGDTVGLDGRDRTHTYIVREFTDAYTQTKRYTVEEDKGNLGQCGNPS